MMFDRQVMAIMGETTFPPSHISQRTLMIVLKCLDPHTLPEDWWQAAQGGCESAKDFVREAILQARKCEGKCARGKLGEEIQKKLLAEPFPFENIKVEEAE